MLAFMPQLTEKELHKELDSIKALLTRSGNIFHEQVWGKRDLYYPMKGQNKAIYVVLNFTFDGDVTPMRREFQLMTPLLRFLMIRLPHNFEVKPFAVLEEKDEKKDAKAAAPVVETKKEVKPAAPVKEEKKPVVKKAPKVVPEEETRPVSQPEPEAEEVVEQPEEEKPAKSSKKKKDFDEGIKDILDNLSDL